MLLELVAMLFITWNPPIRYDYPFEGDLQIVELDPRFIPATCNRLFQDWGYTGHAGPRTIGCAVRTMNKDRCVIVIPTHMTRLVQPSAVRRHEIGHCNGWGPEHEH